MDRTDLIILRNTLVTRLSAARVVAINKQIPTLRIAIEQMIQTIRDVYPDHLWMYVDAVEDLEQSVIEAPHMSAIRAQYAASVAAAHGGSQVAA